MQIDGYAQYSICRDIFYCAVREARVLRDGKVICTDEEGRRKFGDDNKKALVVLEVFAEIV
ncbi:MAG: hypothetical protein DWH88_03905 [Planctomycetota bacterium]|nr:MAG: hypothetical protein DWH88_03905 [Planctomycetota bacterium]